MHGQVLSVCGPHLLALCLGATTLFSTIQLGPGNSQNPPHTPGLCSAVPSAWNSLLSSSSAL